MFSWKEWGIQTGEAVEYYVEVWDNDAVTGPKASRSILYTLRPASEAEKQAVFAQLQDSLARQLQRPSSGVRPSFRNEGSLYLAAEGFAAFRTVSYFAQ